MRKTKTLIVKIDSLLEKQIEAYCLENHLTKSELTRQVLRREVLKNLPKSLTSKENLDRIFNEYKNKL